MRAPPDVDTYRAEVVTIPPKTKIGLDHGYHIGSYAIGLDLAVRANLDFVATFGLTKAVFYAHYGREPELVFSSHETYFVILAKPRVTANEWGEVGL